MKELYDYPHRRFNPLTGEWIKVSPHRTKRPWQGRQESSGSGNRPEYDPECYLCPGNSRAGGHENPQYTGTFSFPNDFAALLEENPASAVSEGLLMARPEQGICKVVCFSPRHDLTLPRMKQEEVEQVIELWKQEYRELGSRNFISHVQIFENHGSLMGCSNPHPHGQIWAEDCLPDIPAKEDARQKDYHQNNGRELLADYLQQELVSGQRIVLENSGFVVLVPYWAVWPYEVMILPRSHLRSLSDFSRSDISDLADAMRRLGILYDNLFETDMPYSMGLHQAPTDGRPVDHWTFHMHYYPPLLRSASIKKFMVGYEMMAMPQRDITPELSARILRELPTIHYSEKEGARV